MLSILKSALTYFLVELGTSETKAFNDFSEILFQPWVNLLLFLLKFSK